MRAAELGLNRIEGLVNTHRPEAQLSATLSEHFRAPRCFQRRSADEHVVLGHRNALFAGGREGCHSCSKYLLCRRWGRWGPVADEKPGCLHNTLPVSLATPLRLLSKGEPCPRAEGGV